MRKQHLFSYLFVILLSSLTSCSEDDAPKKIIVGDLELKFLSKETQDKVDVQNFEGVDVKVSETDDEYYTIYYSFEIHNEGSDPVDLGDYVVQNYLLKDGNLTPAGGRSLSDVILEKGDVHLVEYSANSGSLEEPSVIDGWTLWIVVARKDDVTNRLITLEYMLHQIPE